MTSSLLFGESCSVLGITEGWANIRTDFDRYEGWLNAESLSDHVEFTEVNDALFLTALGNKQRILIPCGGNIPAEGMFKVGEDKFTIEKKLKTNHHLPLSLRIGNIAISFLNVPYLWGGRSFMGVDCSGFVQVVYKACGITLPRDSPDQALCGKPVEFGQLQACDLVFFAKPGAEKVTHVGLMLDDKRIIHASGKVKIDKIAADGIIGNDGLKYKTVGIQRII